ncbi:hypothetical protein CLV63_12389 [Murinocardiopsis flavida]|uniref:Uncharacterized protein n=1 Tax=Murinocardiopsis flavida TaxID=645275 RepID=A0A2P8CZ78_9ACTN|nr:hypothetical protein [Murinocardiopsis flavida]PSK90260.1 hypothetical protein CLV63_12389 [Murinocardiopsis flavida]
MPANDHTEHEETDRLAEEVQSVLFAYDLKRLVRASKENDAEAVAEIRNGHES